MSSPLILCLGDLDCFAKPSEIPLETRVLNIESQVPGSSFEVYTDGSKSDSVAGFAVCILDHGEPYEIFKFKLGVYNTVLQAELAAIDFAFRWALERKLKLILLRITSRPSRPFGAADPGLRWSSGPKKILTWLGGQIGLLWVKAHAGNPGNELADHYDKLATIQGVEMHLPTPYSCLKYRISKNLIREWGVFWDGFQSESGHRIRIFVACVDKKFLVTNKFLIYFLTNHGPFPCYLHRFKKL
ncbi:hypothetical protein AVEN_184397-1 [Araneus ventricosus]|uniref:RNase H type-1 domain-containing protein n=1 Tax=Araneus ventricosus TaxID=182803 RepID=A0A4Y2BHY6_ARAVE|nr:hypothetical protein AVEN_184397-1 [Araneus ventricosus]